MVFLAFVSTILPFESSYLPCKVAPSIESNKAARKPDKIIPYVILLGIGINHHTVRPIMQLPIRDPKVPMRVTPPDRP